MHPTPATTNRYFAVWNNARKLARQEGVKREIVDEFMIELSHAAGAELATGVDAAHVVLAAAVKLHVARAAAA